MEILFEIIVVQFIIRFLGLRTRHLFFKTIGYEKSIDQLKGKKSDFYNSVNNGFYNAIVGFMVFIGLSFGIAYLFYLAGLL